MNYREEEMLGSKWRRCHLITIVNNKDTPPTIQFQEEDVYSSDSFEVRQPAGSIFEIFDPEKTVDLVNPLTLEPIGTTMSYQDIYVILFSAYIGLAKQRDIKENE